MCKWNDLHAKLIEGNGQRLFLCPFSYSLFSKSLSSIKSLKKPHKFGFNKLLKLGLCNLISGMVFGTGCVIAEHIDSNWLQSQDASTPEKIAASEQIKN